VNSESASRAAPGADSEANPLPGRPLGGCGLSTTSPAPWPRRRGRAGPAHPRPRRRHPLAHRRAARPHHRLAAHLRRRTRGGWSADIAVGLRLAPVDTGTGARPREPGLGRVARGRTRQAHDL